ncbi:ROK family protein [Galliscardovia ingluviei]|uniref:ROK family protein n=1 Tax=Galliscardovia ingluviei TaxID=1769422 RepID=UPI00166E864D|nr:ROK family protein [Galliscardovia ingluviei]
MSTAQHITHQPHQSAPTTKQHSTPAPKQPNNPQKLPQSAQRIVQYLAAHHNATKQELKTACNLSLPTINHAVSTLQAQHIIVESERRASTGGRAALAYAYNPNHRIALGVSVNNAHVVVIATDMRGNIVLTTERTMVLRTDSTADIPVCVEIIRTAITQLERNPLYGPVAGITITVSTNKPNAALRPANLPVTLTTMWSADAFERALHIPCTMVTHTLANAQAELTQQSVQSAIFLCIGTHPDGIVMINGRALQPPVLQATSPRITRSTRSNTALSQPAPTASPLSSRFAHMPVDPNGPQCSCGQHGCFTALCSLSTLPEDYESIPGFFSVLDQGEAEHKRRMNTWLSNIAHVIVLAQSFIDLPVIIGGDAAMFLADDDFHALQQRVHQLSTIPTQSPILRSVSMQHQDAYGAAILIALRERERYGTLASQ